ncbi:ArnT family glycosyltransferase [Micromonospora sp. NPDC003197]
MIAAMIAGVRQKPADQARPRTYWHLRLPVLLALLVGLAGVGYRLALLLADAPPTNSDEATMGLAALRIARGEDFPVWFYGQAYMGTLEAYLAAPIFALFGPSVLALRLPTLAMFALFLALSWRLTRRLGGDPWFALLVVGFLALGSDRVVKNQLIAGGGYPEMNPAGAALALLTVELCLGGSGRRLPRWAIWGLISGIMLWADPLLLPYILGTGVVLAVWRRRELAGRAGLVAAGTMLLGAAPMLLDSIWYGRNPLAAVLTASGGGASAGWGDRLYGGLVLGPPLGMGFCSPSHCTIWQFWWALAFPVLLVLGALLAWRTLRAARGPAGEPGDEQRVSAAVRLALLAGAAAVLAAYVVSSSAGRTPVESARYLSCLTIAMPALLWPLWQAARRRSGGLRVVASAVLAAILGTAAWATVAAIRTVPATHAEAERHRTLVDTLDELGVRHVYGGYWTCNRLTFATTEDVVCAVVKDDLTPGLDRIRAYRPAVAADPGAAWVVPVDSPLATQLDQRIGTEPGAFDVVTVPGWRVYLPRS